MPQARFVAAEPEPTVRSRSGLLALLVNRARSGPRSVRHTKKPRCHRVLSNSALLGQVRPDLFGDPFELGAAFTTPLEAGQLLPSLGRFRQRSGRPAIFAQVRSGLVRVQPDLARSGPHLRRFGRIQPDKAGLESTRSARCRSGLASLRPNLALTRRKFGQVAHIG